MNSRRFDEWTRTLGRSGTRRSMLLASGSAIAGMALTRFAGRARAQSSGCVDDNECPEGQVCVDGFCFFPECWPAGSGCASHDDCCEYLLCLSGVCTTSPTCGTEGDGCTGESDCCPGLTCAAGACALAQPAPPVDSGGGGSENPAPSNTGGSQTGTSAASSGTTLADEPVFRLPETGVGPERDGNGAAWLLPGAVATAILVLRKRIPLRDERN